MMRELTRGSELGARGFVLEQVWRTDVQRYLASEDDLPAAIWLSLTLELWLRHQTRRLPDLP